MVNPLFVETSIVPILYYTSWIGRYFAGFDSKNLLKCVSVSSHVSVKQATAPDRETPGATYTAYLYLDYLVLYGV